MDRMKSIAALCFFILKCRFRDEKVRIAISAKRAIDRAYVPLPVQWVSRRGGRTSLGLRFGKIRVGLFCALCHFTKPEAL